MWRSEGGGTIAPQAVCNRRQSGKGAVGQIVIHNTPVRRIFISVVAFSAVVASMNEQIRKPFGIDARPSLLALKLEVERGFGHAIIERVSEPGGPAFGSYEIDDNGVPTITLAKDDLTEADLAHELMHLKLILQGHPRIEWRVSENRFRTKEMADELYRLRVTIRDSIEHFIFRPAIVAMGIKADPEDVGVLTRYVQDKHPTKEEKWFSITRFFSLTLSVEDPAMNRQLVASYTKNGLRAEALRGENMARQVRMMPAMKLNVSLRASTSTGLGKGRPPYLRSHLKGAATSTGGRRLFWLRFIEVPRFRGYQLGHDPPYGLTSGIANPIITPETACNSFTSRGPPNTATVADASRMNTITLIAQYYHARASHPNKPLCLLMWIQYVTSTGSVVTDIGFIGWRPYKYAKSGPGIQRILNTDWAILNLPLTLFLRHIHRPSFSLAEAAPKIEA